MFCSLVFIIVAFNVHVDHTYTIRISISVNMRQGPKVTEQFERISCRLESHPFTSIKIVKDTQIITVINGYNRDTLKPLIDVTPSTLILFNRS